MDIKRTLFCWGVGTFERSGERDTYRYGSYWSQERFQYRYECTALYVHVRTEGFSEQDPYSGLKRWTYEGQTPVQAIKGAGIDTFNDHPATAKGIDVNISRPSFHVSQFSCAILIFVGR